MDVTMYATSCTYGKGTAHRINAGKNAIILIDPRRGKAVRVAVKPEFLEKSMQSEFVKLRSQGIPAQDISEDIVNSLIERVLSLDDKQMFNVSDIFDMTIERPKGTFNFRFCEDCGELVFDTCLREKDGKVICFSCAGEVKAGPVK